MFEKDITNEDNSMAWLGSMGVPLLIFMNAIFCLICLIMDVLLLLSITIHTDKTTFEKNIKKGCIYGHTLNIKT